MEAGQNHSLDALGYLPLKDHPSSWILNHYNFRCWVEILDLGRPHSIEEIGDVIRFLPNLTHLYIGDRPNVIDPYKLAKNLFESLPDTAIKLIHLSLHNFELHDLSMASLAKLSNLKSLDLCLPATDLPAELDLLFCLERLTLRNLTGDYSIPDRVAKLSNLNTMEFYGCDQVSFPENLRIVKLKLVCSAVDSLPASLCDLETIHDKDYCKTFCGDDFKTCLKQLTNLKTLSLTCCRLKSLPCIAELQNLQNLLLKNCFGLKTLLLTLDESVQLCTLDVSGTRIRSLPECITKLPKLQHLVLPKCFELKYLPHQFLGNESIMKIDFDGMDEKYYKDFGYYDSDYESSTERSDKHNETFNEGIEITLGSEVELNDILWRDSGEEGIINVQTSSCRLPNPPEATQGVGGIHSMAIFEDMITELTMNFGNEGSTISSSPQLNLPSSAHDGNTQHAVAYAQNRKNSSGAHKKGNGRKKGITREEIQTLRDERITLIEACQKLGVSRSTMKRLSKKFGLGDWPSSRKKRKTNTKSPSGGEFSELSQHNLVKCNNPAGTEYANECLDVNPHTLSGQVAPDSVSVENSTPQATTKSVVETNVASHRHMDVRDPVQECTVGADVHPLLSSANDSSSSSNFDIKATYKEYIVRFKWSSTACLKELKEAVVENLEIEVDSFRLNYQDEEEDWVLINTNEHLKRALSLIKNNILRLKVADL